MILDRPLNYSALFIPLFFLLVWLEAQYMKKLGKSCHVGYENSISNINIGIAERLIHLFVGIIFYNLFVLVYDRFSLFHIQAHWWTWPLLLLAADFVWYWYHRLGHMVNLFWAAHIVHHQSTDFNFTVGARITTVQAFIRYGFWAVLPLLGFHPDMVISILLVHGIYSFFTHTKAIKLPKWMETIFITPSLHGVHHASNEIYLDKNFGDVFVFWDKLFGTFQREEEPPVYGLVHPLRNHGFLWQHFHYFLEIALAAKRKNGIREKVAVLFGRPSGIDPRIRPFLENRLMVAEKHQAMSFGGNVRAYLTVQVVWCVLMLTYVTLYWDILSLTTRLFVAAFIFMTLVHCGSLMEKKSWTYNLEITRASIVAAFLSCSFQSLYPIMVLLSILIMAEYSFGWKERYQLLLFEGRTGYPKDK